MDKDNRSAEMRKGDKAGYDNFKILVIYINLYIILSIFKIIYKNDGASIINIRSRITSILYLCKIMLL